MRLKAKPVQSSRMLPGCPPSSAAAILCVLKDDNEGLSLGKIAGRVGLARSTVQRIVNAMRPYLAAFRVDHMAFIEQIVGPHRLRAVATVGESFPLTLTANGKACLVLMDNAHNRGSGDPRIALQRPRHPGAGEIHARNRPGA